MNLPVLMKDIPQHVSSYLLHQKSTNVAERYSSTCVFMFPSPEMNLPALAKDIPQHVSS